jgi:hypothetical protein
MGQADSLRSVMSKPERETYRPARSRALRHLYADQIRIGNQKKPAEAGFVRCLAAL